MTWELMQKKSAEQVDECLKIAPIIYKCYPSSFDMWDCPVPKSVALLYAAHEMGLAKVDGKWIPHRWLATPYVEYSIMNITANKGRDNEMGRFNIYPYDPYSNLWAAQMSFQENIKLVSKYLKDAGFVAFDNLFIGDQISLILMPRAVGCGATRVLLKKSFNQRFAQRPIIAISKFLEKTTTNTDAYDGNQDTDKVRLRMLWCATMPLRAHELEIDNPLTDMILKPAKPRDNKVLPLPGDFYERTDHYHNKERKLGSCCELS